MYVLYQIGDVNLYDSLLGFNGDPVSAELSYAWGNPLTTFEGGGTQYHSPLTRSLPEPVEFEVKGKLFQTPYLRVSQLKTRIRSFAGRRNIPVIVFHYEEGECDPEIRWLIGYGIITETSNNHTYHSQENNANFITQDIELTVVLQQPFVQLSSWFWELRDIQERLLDPYSSQASQAGLNRFSHPQHFEDIPPNYYFVRWQEPDTAYNPTFWGMKNLYEMSYGGYSSDFIAGPHELFLYASEDSWAISPRVIYAFTGLTALGEISIETEMKTGLYRNETLSTVSSLDLVQLDIDLSNIGYGGLLLDDVVYTGATNIQPGFVERYGESLEGIRPRWDYEFSYPGEIPAGASWIRFSSYLTDTQVAYSIDFRTS